MRAIFGGVLVFFLCLFLYVRHLLSGYGYRADVSMQQRAPVSAELYIHHAAAELYTAQGVLTGFVCVTSVRSLGKETQLEGVDGLYHLSSSGDMMFIHAEHAKWWSDEHVHFSGHVLLSLNQHFVFPDDRKRPNVCSDLRRLNSSQ